MLLAVLNKLPNASCRMSSTQHPPVPRLHPTKGYKYIQSSLNEYFDKEPHIIPENKTVVYSTCLTEGSWSSVTLNCKYDPGFLSGKSQPHNTREMEVL